MQRRNFLLSSGSAAFAALPLPALSAEAASPTFASPPPLSPIRAKPDRIIDISVCTRPFRAQGPRIEAERRYGKTIVHNYGHGGAGWSLSWGSARLALEMISATRERHIAIIGCGAIGLTTARVAQRAGLRVKIYCKDRPPEVRSSAATGSWSPDSRICTEEHATPEFQQRWEAMARYSFKVYQSLLGLPGNPIEWYDGYVLSDVPFDQPLPATGEDNEPDYPDLEERIRDLRPKSQLLTPAEHPFRVPYARRYTQMAYNVPTYTKLLMDEFFREGGEIEQREFTHPRQFAGLKERTIVNATGYGARALLGDETIIPVHGQTARLVPQPEVNYGLLYRGHNVFVMPRRDGILVQAQGEHDFNNDDTRPDRAASEAAVERLAALFAPPIAA